MFNISFDFTTAEFILGSQNEGTTLFHFHFCQFLLFPPTLSLALENSAFELQKLSVTYFQTGGRKTQTLSRKYFYPFALPLLPLELFNSI